MTYESARSISGPYLATFGVSAAVVGFVAGFGIFWFLGSFLMGILYDVSIISLVIFSVTIQLLAVPLLWIVMKKLNNHQI